MFSIDAIEKRFRVWEFWLPGFVVVLCTGMFFFSDADLVISGYFFDEAGKDWPYEKKPWVKIAYHYGPYIAGFCLIAALLSLALSFLFPKYHYVRAKSLLIIIVIILLPTFLVHSVLKGTWERPRPREVSQFMGPHPFVPVLKINQNGFNGQSFPSGHAAAGFVLFFSYFLWKRKNQKQAFLWLLSTLAISTWIGAARIAAGGHFASDVLWSFFLCWYGNYLLYYFWYLPYQKRFKNRRPFIFRWFRIWLVGGIISILIGIGGYFYLQVSPYFEKLENRFIQIPESLASVDIVVRLNRGNVDVYTHKLPYIAFVGWAKGAGPDQLQVDVQVDRKILSPKNHVYRFITKPNSWYWKYQNHVTVFVPEHLKIRWDVETELGEIFWFPKRGAVSPPLSKGRLLLFQ